MFSNVCRIKVFLYCLTTYALNPLNFSAIDHDQVKNIFPIVCPPPFLVVGSLKQKTFLCGFPYIYI